MEPSEQKKPFNRRAFVSLILLASGLMLPLSGVMNHSLQFEPLTQARHFWMSVHNMSALIFSISAFMHISTNWRSLIYYVKKIQGVLISKEAITAFVLVFGIVFLFASHTFHVR